MGVAGLSTGIVNIDVEFERRDVAGRGTVFEINGRSAAPAENPLQPIVSVDATGADADADGVPDRRLHGALLRSGTAYTVGTIDPIYQTPTINGSEREPELQPLDAVFPISPLAVSDADTEFGPRDFVVAQPGRFTATQPDGTGTQVLYDELSVQTLHSASNDWTAPTIGTVTQTVVGGALAITVSTPSTDVAGVVVSVVENLGTATETVPTAWRTFDLQGAGAGRWSGGFLLSACTEELQYLVQIYDTAGNVRVMSNKAAGFTSSCSDDPPPPPSDVLAAAPAPAPGPSGWFAEGDVVTIEVESTLAGPFSYRIDGGAPKPLGDTMEFTISGSGVRTYSVTAPGSAPGTTAVASGTVRIDDGDPTVSIVSPGGGDVLIGVTVPVMFSCADASPVSCTGTLTLPDGTEEPVASDGTIATRTLGTYRLTVRAIDALGNDTVISRTFRVVDLVFEGFFPPLAPDDPSDPQVLNVVKAGKSVKINWAITSVDGTPITSTSGIKVEHRFEPCPGVAGSFGRWTSAPASGGGLKFKGNRFEFKLKTDKQWAGQCGAVRVTFGDGQTAEARFGYRGDGSPTATIVAPAEGNVVTGSDVTVEYSCADPSLVSCTGKLTRPDGSEEPVASGDTIETPPLGTYTLTVVALNAFGDETRARRTFRVVDPLVFDGFFSPFDRDDPSDPQVLNVVKAGKSIKIKWAITSWDGTPITSTSGMTVRHRFEPCPGVVGGSPGASTPAPSSGGGVEYKGKKFEFELQTNTQWAGRCGVVQVTFGDGQTAAVRFSYR